MSSLLKSPTNGFRKGSKPITSFQNKAHGGIGITCSQYQAHAHVETTTETETAWLLMTGSCECQIEQSVIQAKRDSIFDENPFCLHLPKGKSLQIKHHTDTEWLVFTVNNTKAFSTQCYHPQNIRSEKRGLGQVDNASLRIVRTIFDNDNSDQNAELVLGEVITMPGRWSSYPPHHHPQPEIYHYRFDKPQGYGHAQMGEELYKVHHGDTLIIQPNCVHDQVSAPGYAMYYVWVIRHLPKQRYTIPTFEDAHAWTMNSNADVWHAKEISDV